MIIRDIRLGRLSFLAQRESDHQTIRMTREPGEVIIDLPYLRLFLSNYCRTTQNAHKGIPQRAARKVP